MGCLAWGSNLRSLICEASILPPCIPNSLLIVHIQQFLINIPFKVVIYNASLKIISFPSDHAAYKLSSHWGTGDKNPGSLTCEANMRNCWWCVVGKKN